MAIQKQEDEMESEDYPKYTKKDIAKENARNRRTNTLVPLGNRVYDFKQMFEIIQCRIDDVIPNKRFTQDFADQKLMRAKAGPSTYLGLLGTCKFLEIPVQILQETMERCVKGSIKYEPFNEQSSDFKNNVTLVLQSLSDESSSSGFSSNIVIFKQSCENWSQKESAVFADKFFPPITQYQDQYAFPKPVSYGKKVAKKHCRAILSPEKQEEYFKQSVALAIEGMNEIISEEANRVFDHSIRNDSMKEYLLHYRKTYIKSCEVQMRECTMLKDTAITTKEFDEVEFPLPGYSKNKQLRLFLLDDSFEKFVFDAPLDGIAWKHLPETDVNVYKTDTEETNAYFEELLSKRCSDEIFCTDIEDETVWETNDKNLDVIKNDVLLEKQVAVIKSREHRTDLSDTVKIKKRWNNRLKYFFTKYELSDYDTELFSGWFERYEVSVNLFHQLCEGTFQQKPRESFDKVKYANEQYEILMSNRPKLTEEAKRKIEMIQEMKIKYFIKSYKYCDEKMTVYRNWLQRMEENQLLLDELCKTGIVKNDPFEPCVSYLAVFASYEAFENIV